MAFCQRGSPDIIPTQVPYLTTDPIAILQNLFGGGQVQQQRMAITDLEIRAADLEAARAELERQRAAKRSQIGEQVLMLVIAYETAGDRERAILAQLSNHDLLTRITEIDYRLGGSSTETYLTRIAQREQLEIQLNRYRLERETAKRQLLSLTGFSPSDDLKKTSEISDLKTLW
jgi:outer membrane protein TolC